MDILKLRPAFKDYLWGGIKLKEDFRKQSNLDIVAESWELSAHPDGSSYILNGEYKGKSLQEYFDIVSKSVWGTMGERFKEFPILIKYIDAKQALSIQVHPNDEYALKVEHEFGKNEMWYILDCEPGSYLYFGVNQAITKEDFQSRIENNTLLEVLNKVEVKKGDCFFIEAGTIHAIGAGILICEIQQNSNSTYRVYDFGRVGVDGKPRELHIQKAIDVSTLTPNSTKGLQVKKIEKQGYSVESLADTPYFTTQLYKVTDTLKLEATKESFQSLNILEGQGVLRYANKELNFQKGDCFFVPAQLGHYELQGEFRLITTNI